MLATWLAGVAVLVVVSALVLAPLEWLARRRGPSWRAALVPLAWLLASSLVGALAARGFSRAFDPTAAPAWPRFLVALLLAELLLYAVHRAMHASPWLWRFHRVHHAAPHLWWLEAWRQHPVDAALHLAALLTPALLLDVPLAAHAPALLLRRIYTALLHADLSPRPSRLDRWLATPAFHHRHHHPHAPAANFAGTLALIDAVFGTWRDAHDSAQP